jgi:hypothetical protein
MIPSYLFCQNRLFLSRTAFRINTSQKEQPKKEVSYMKAIIYIGVLILLIGISSYLIKIIIYKKYSKYSILKNKILKQYDDRIVTVSNFIKYDKWEIVD